MPYQQQPAGHRRRADPYPPRAYPHPPGTYRAARRTAEQPEPYGPAVILLLAFASAVLAAIVVASIVVGASTSDTDDQHASTRPTPAAPATP